MLFCEPKFEENAVLDTCWTRSSAFFHLQDVLPGWDQDSEQPGKVPSLQTLRPMTSLPFFVLWSMDVCKLLPKEAGNCLISQSL